MPEDVMLQEAIQAVRQGQRARARDLLTRLLRLDQNNPDYWLWMSAVVDSANEQVYCLETALRIQPGNAAARQGLVLLGALPGEQHAQLPRQMPRQMQRNWQPDLMEIPKRSFWSNPKARMAAFSFSAILTISLVVWGTVSFASANERAVAIIPTSTPGPSPTYTLTPTAVNVTALPPTRTPRGVVKDALGAKLQLSYTPTPLVVNTPHAANEAYRIAQRAYQQGDLEKALEHFNQAGQMEKSAADIPFYTGEIHFIQQNFSAALEAYQQAIDIDPDFAPAYLGRTLTNHAIESAAGSHRANRPDDLQETLQAFLKDIQQAVDLDPAYFPARLELAAGYIRLGEVELALEQLEAVEEILPASAQSLALRAQIEILQDQSAAALQSAQEALKKDKGYLPAYRILGRAALLNQKPGLAVEHLKTYLDYEQKDAEAWLWYGQALYGSSRYSQSVSALDTALGLDTELVEAYTTRGLAYIELEEGQKAVNDFLVVFHKQPKSFNSSLNLGRGLLAAGRFVAARDQLSASQRLAQADEELAQVFYHRALANEALEDHFSALKDWQALVDLPEQAANEMWLQAARSALRPTATPSKTPAPTKTTKASATASKTVTLPAKTPTPTPSPTPRP